MSIDRALETLESVVKKCHHKDTTEWLEHMLNSYSVSIC